MVKHRRVVQKEYLVVAKAKKRTEKQICSLLRKEWECVRRDLGYIGAYLEGGYALQEKAAFVWIPSENCMNNKNTCMIIIRI